MPALVKNPFDGMSDLFTGAVVLFVIFVLVVFFLLRLRWWIARRGFRPTYGALGNAFQELQRLGEPRVEYILEEKSQDEKEEDDEGGPDKAGK